MNIANRISKGYEVNKIVTFSTAHVREGTLLLLEQTSEITASLVCYPKAEYGYFIVVPYDDFDSLGSDFPEDLMRLLRIGASHDAYYIELDQDAPEYPNLQTYEW